MCHFEVAAFWQTVPIPKYASEAGTVFVQRYLAAVGDDLRKVVTARRPCPAGFT